MAYKEPHMNRDGAKALTEALGQVNANMVKGKKAPAKKPAPGKAPAKKSGK